MKLWYNKKATDPIYYVQKGTRFGKRVSCKNVEKIGKHSELLAKGIENPLEYAKEYVANLNKNINDGKVDIVLNINLSDKLKETKNIYSKNTSVNIGYFYLQYIYNQLKLKEFFNKKTKETKIEFNCNDINRFLTFARILEPKSKLGTYDNLDQYFEKPQIQYYDMLRFMDFLEQNFDSYLDHLFLNSENVVKRDTTVCYYDCTNYYFEIETEDENYVDEVTGEIMPGFRKYGHAKQHQPAPLVQMGLFMDSSGIPIYMQMTPGNTNEQLTCIPTESKMLKLFKNPKIIYCADAGLGSLNIRTFNDMIGRGFIVTQSIKKLSDALKEEVFKDEGYKLLSNDTPTTIKSLKEFDKFDPNNLNLYNDKAYKILQVDKAVDLGFTDDYITKKGNVRHKKSKATLFQRVIITFSRKMLEYQRNIRNNQIQRAKDLVSSNKVEKAKKGPNDVTRFIKRVSNGDVSYEIDEDVIKEEEKYDGYYAIATNLTDDDVKPIFEINSRRYKIEDCFRVLKTNFRARPVYHQKENRIKAHFLVCYTALLIYRLLECRLNRVNHFTINEIINTLKNMRVANISDTICQSIYTSSEVLKALNQEFDLELDKGAYFFNDLRKKIKKIL